MTPPSLRVGVAIPAAGAGRRMGGSRKPFLEVAGEPTLARALRPFLADPRVVSVVVALDPATAEAPPAWVEALDPRVTVVAGGDTRAESVGRALDAIGDVDVLVVHDAARPLVDPDVIGRCIGVAASGVGAVAGVPVVDTVKEVDAEGFVLATPDRSRLWQAQTPQAFPADALRRAYRLPLEGATDDASLVERLGLPVRMVEAGSGNLKITRPGDVAIAEAILRDAGA